MTDLLELSISILEAGGIYGLMALAYLLVLRPTGIINFAVGEWATLAAFFAVATLTWWQLPYLAGALLALAAIAAVGALSERLVIRPMVERGAPLLTPILILLGMVVVYRESAALGFGTQNLRVPPPFGFGRIELFGIGAPTSRRLMPIRPAATRSIATAWNALPQIVRSKNSQVARNTAPVTRITTKLWVGAPMPWLNSAGVAEELGLPSGFEPSVAVILGHPDEQPVGQPRGRPRVTWCA